MKSLYVGSFARMKLVVKVLYSTSLRPNKGAGILSGKSILSKKPVKNVHPAGPVRTRFAPSPTGMLHIGSLRTALYNYLLAKNAGGQFLLRLEDTDQKRLVEGAEHNIYESLQWCGIEYDEGPGVSSGKYGPYRQSDRTDIYRRYIDGLLESGHAYRCFCSKKRLDDLRDSARLLQPPTTVSYDRHCAHLSEEEIARNLKEKSPFTVRMKAPDHYPFFEDLLHGEINIQPQVNKNDIRYDDPILVKSDNLPTYHFANVIDDHLMKITHVIRGEEWLPSTQKHIALYNALGWTPPKFIHIPLLTSTDEKKLSKRKGDSSVLSMKKKGVLPEALVNFCVLFGWSPPRVLASANHECFSLADFEKMFNLNYLTKGNAKVDDKKLWFFNKHYLQQKLKNPSTLDKITEQVYFHAKEEFTGEEVTHHKIKQILVNCGQALTTINDFNGTFYFFFRKPNYLENPICENFIKTHEKREIISILEALRGNIDTSNIDELIKQIAKEKGFVKKTIFESLRFALAGSHSGAKMATLINIIGPDEANTRLSDAVRYLEQIKEL